MSNTNAISNFYTCAVFQNIFPYLEPKTSFGARGVSKRWEQLLRGNRPLYELLRKTVFPLSFPLAFPAEMVVKKGCLSEKRLTVKATLSLEGIKVAPVGAPGAIVANDGTFRLVVKGKRVYKYTIADPKPLWKKRFSSDHVTALQLFQGKAYVATGKKIWFEDVSWPIRSYTSQFAQGVKITAIVIENGLLMLSVQKENDVAFNRLEIYRREGSFCPRLLNTLSLDAIPLPTPMRLISYSAGRMHLRSGNTLLEGDVETDAVNEAS